MPRPIILAIAAGLLTAFSFPPYNFSILAWVSFVPLFFALNQSSKPSWQLGFIMGSVANAIIFVWLWRTFEAAQVGWITTFLSWIALSSILAIYFALFSYVFFILKDTRFAIFSIPATWICLESIRSTILTGFPWALLSHSQIYHPTLIQVASVTGAPGISFLIMLINVGLFKVIFQRQIKAGILALMAFVMVYGFGWNRLNNAVSTDNLQVALLQGNIDQYQKWDDQYEQGIRETYEDLSLQSLSHNPDLIIWPESAIPGWYPRETFYRDWIQRISERLGRYQIIGSVSSVLGKDYNSVFLIDPTGKPLDRYDKIKLVPFGEYIPFGKFLGRWVPYLGQLGTFDAGIRSASFLFKGFQLSPSICYEAVFPGLIRRQVLRGSQLLINVTNDGWFLDTGAPEQHFAANIFRSVENKRSLLRAANTGISGIINPYGQILMKSKLLQKEIVHGAVPVVPEGDLTFYTRWGNWFPYLCWIFIICILPYHVRRTFRPTQHPVKEN